MDQLAGRDLFAFTKAIALRITKKYPNPTSAIILADTYRKEYGLEDKNDPADALVGTVLFSEQESIDDFVSYTGIIDAYIKYDIKKFYGLTIDEFTNRSRYSRDKLIEMALETMERLAKELEEAKNKIDGDNKKLTTGLSNGFGDLE